MLPYLRDHMPLVTLGACMEFVYLVHFVRYYPLLQYYQVDIDMGGITGHSHLGFASFVLMFTLLFVLFGLAWWMVREAEDHRLLWLILALGAVYGVTMTFVYPITAIDIFAYVDQSLVMVQYHHNPIFTPPAAFPFDPLMSLSGDWRQVGAPYGPLGLVIDAIPALFVGHNLLANMILLKLMFSAMTLACAFLVYLILRRVHPSYAVGGALLVAWNPLVVFEVSANGHNDVAMMLFALLGLLALVEGDLTLGVVLLMASALIKYSTLVLLPLYLVYGLSRQSSKRARATYLLVTAVCTLVVAVMAYAPFWRGIGTLNLVLSQNQRYLVSFSSVTVDLIPRVFSLAQAANLGRALFVVVYGYAVWLATRRSPDLLRACFLAMFSFVALGLTNFETWYGIWPAMLAATVARFAERMSSILFSYGTSLLAALFGYVWVWIGLTTPGSFSLVNDVSYVLAFVPAAVALILLSWLPPEPEAPTPPLPRAGEGPG